MNSEAPQLHKNPNRGRYHPHNLVVPVVNGIARLEHWRRQEPDRSAIDEKIQAIRARTDSFAGQEREMRALKLLATVHPEKEYQEPLLEAQRAYHADRARVLGERAVGLKENNSLFSPLRATLIERRQAHHRSKARKASNGLLKLYSS